MVGKSKLFLLLFVVGGTWFLSACNSAVTDAHAVDVGTSMSCLTTTSGAVECWGDVPFLAPSGPSPTAVPVPGLESGVTDVSVGSISACAVQAGVVKCWGSNLHGVLGDGTIDSDATPKAVLGLPVVDVVDVEVSSFTACVLLTDGTVWCWGYGGDGQLGNGADNQEFSPQQVDFNGMPAEVLESGKDFYCATVASSVRCWGRGEQGQLGNGVFADSNVPVKVIGLSQVSELRLGRNHACVIVDEVKCWGGNANSQLSNSTITDWAEPLSATWWTPTPVSLELGHNLTCGILANGEVHCLGSDGSGRLGNGPALANTISPSLMIGTETVGVTQMDGGPNATCVVGTDGSLRCVGSNNSWGLGMGDGPDSEVLVNVLR